MFVNALISLAIWASPPLCVELPPEAHAHLSALRIETRKARRGWRWQRLEPGRCPRGAVVSLRGDQITIRLGERARTLPAEAGPRGFARAVVNHLSEEEILPLLKARDVLPERARVEEAWRWRWRVEGGGGGSLGDVTLYGPSVGVSVDVSESLTASVSGHDLFGATRGDVDVEVEALELVLMAYHRAPLTSELALGGGLGLGWQRRSLAANSALREAPDVARAADLGFIALAGALWYDPGPWVACLTLGPDLRINTPTHTWLGREVDAPQRVVASGRVHVGVRF